MVKMTDADDGKHHLVSAQIMRCVCVRVCMCVWCVYTYMIEFLCMYVYIYVCTGEYMFVVYIKKSVCSFIYYCSFIYFLYVHLYIENT